jgi:hypothetical protein
LTASAHAAKKPPPKKEETKVEKATPAPAPDPTPAPAPFVKKKSPNAPMPFGSGYVPFGSRGGATFNGASGLRMSAFGGNHNYGDGYGLGGLEAHYFFGGSKNVDFGLGLRLAGWPVGAAPGLELRVRLVNAGPFHMALSLGAYAPFTFAGMFAGITIGANVEVGLLFSYFFADNIEFLFGVMVPATLHFVGFSYPVPEIGFAGRLGFVYIFKTINFGLMFLHDIAPGFYAPGGFPRAQNGLATARAEPFFNVGVNFMIGVQIKL